MLTRLFDLMRSPQRPARLYETIVAQARQPDFYGVGRVPDSVDGRFEMIVLHLIPVLDRLHKAGEEARAGGQALFDLFFRDMDQSLREMGTGDLVVPKRIRRMAENVYGHAAVYRRLLEDDDKAGLADAIARNVPMEEEAFAAPLAGYLQAVHRVLGDVDVDEVLRGGVRWPAPPSR